MTDKSKYTVLAAGEKYLSEWAKKPKPPMSDPPVIRTLDEARAHLAPQIGAVLRGVQRIPQRARLDEVVVELRLDEKFLAKSYHPEELLKKTGLTLRGLGTWSQTKPIVPRKNADKTRRLPEVEEKSSRILFVSGSQDALAHLDRAIAKGISNKTDADICKIEHLSLPTATERLSLMPEQLAANLGLEIVLYDWDLGHRDEAIRRLRAFLTSCGVSEDRVRERSYPDGPTFVGTVVPKRALPAIGEMNFLRVARPLHRVTLSRGRVGKIKKRQPLRTAMETPKTWIAVFDAGFANPHNQLDGYVKIEDLTTAPAEEGGVAHGTAVVGAALYGSFDPDSPLPTPGVGVLAYRVLPDPQSDELELYGALDAIERKVAELPSDVRVINLSFGPTGPIDELPSRFTYTLDRLSRSHEKLFFTAVGNDGRKAGADRVQSPADSVNNVGVGAYRLDDSGAREPADYSCKGPGRGGSRIKPDFLAFGGCEDRPFVILDPESDWVSEFWGTSLATPLVASLAGQMDGRLQSRLSPEALRALLIHSADSLTHDVKSRGHGVVAENPEEVLQCDAKRVSVLYQHDITPRLNWKLPFLLPPDFQVGGKVSFSWTICFSPEVDHASGDEYTLAGLDVQFRPNSDRYFFSPPKGASGKAVQLNVEEDKLQVQKLIAAGWKQSPVPVSDSPPARRETELRAKEAKWETVVRDQRRKMGSSIVAPLLTVSILGRGDWDKKDPKLKARFAAVLTVIAPEYDGDLYADILANFDQLKPLQLRSRAGARVRIKM